MAAALGRSKGAVQFAALAQTQREIAQRIGLKSSGLVAMWKTGERTPKLANRKQILAKFKIPIEAWDEPPQSPSEWGDPAASGRVARLEAMAADAEAQISKGEGMTIPERLRAMKMLTLVEGEIRKLKGEDVAEVDILTYPAFVAFEKKLRDALRPFPDALAAVVEVFARPEGKVQ